jgi:Kef-type K+ transport system membrane component KefB
MFAAVCSAILLAAFATEWIGIHALFGAFLLGAMLPHDSALARDLQAKCEDLVSVLLLPLFFAFTGLRTQIGLLNSGREWLVCGVIILVASLGKFGGSYAAARFAGVEWREAASLGVLMNTRGLMELIVLNVGLDLGVLSPELFAMFVVMALVTTLATSPILEVLELKQKQAAAS